MASYEEYFQNLERNIVSPLDRVRVKKILERNGWSYQVGNEGDTAGAWGNRIHHFGVMGDRDSVLCVRGAWHGKLRLDDFMLVSSLYGRWSTGYYWPKTYAQVADNHELLVYTELPISYHAGLTDSQLDRHLHCALELSENFFGKLGGKFPQFNEDTPDEGA